MRSIPRDSWLSSKAEVRKSPIHNLGLFANAKIRKNDTVAILGGTKLTDEEVDQLIKIGERYDGVALNLNSNLAIAPKDWLGIHGNHSCDPNLWMKDEVTIVARRDIKVDEELTTDYAMYTISKKWSMECRCGSLLCRDFITGNDWKLHELQDRYRGHFSPFIEMMITRERE
jgi:hypothetical protein